MSSPQLVEVVTVIKNWHSKKLDHLKKVSECVKEGVTLKLQGSEDKSTDVVVTAREALIFQLGVHAAISEFKTLPFSVKTRRRRR